MAYTGAVNVEKLASVELRDSSGDLRRLGDFWSDRNVVLVFLRHFG
jgi:hypothetical protein